MQQLRSGLYANSTFNMLDDDGGVLVQRGLHAMTNAGYCRWLCLMYLLRHPLTLRERRCSKRCESVRKDTECTFGVLKKSFYILKAGFHFRTALKIDNVFFPCCVLHNMLLHNDDLDTIGAREGDWKEVDFGLDQEQIRRDIEEEAAADAGPSSSGATVSSSLQGLRQALRNVAAGDNDALDRCHSSLHHPCIRYSKRTQRIMSGGSSYSLTLRLLFSLVVCIGSNPQPTVVHASRPSFVGRS
eukprot:3417781-Pleurochrysis_carterae.AAC.1